MAQGFAFGLEFCARTKPFNTKLSNYVELVEGRHSDQNQIQANEQKFKIVKDLLD